jgi:hypothetical protein
MNVYEIVTEKIMEQMKAGVIPWQRPWHSISDEAISYVSRKPYSLLNQMLLGIPGEFLTRNQIKALGGNIKKGAKAQFVVFFRWVIKGTHKVLTNEEAANTKPEDLSSLYPMLRYYYVFHLSDTEGIPTKIKEDEPVVKIKPVEAAEAIIRDYSERTDLCIKQVKSNGAYYSPLRDEVVVPLLDQFDNSEQFYATLFHECVHSTGAKKRLNRPTITETNFFGDENYSREELIAEMGSAMLCNRLGIDTESVFKNTVAYLQSWLEALRNDKYMVVWAASRSEKAVKLILNEVS